MESAAKARAREVGSRIREARWKTGLSQERFAVLVGTSRRQVMRWEGGYHAATRESLQSIAQATGVALDWLETGGNGDDVEAAMRRSVRRLASLFLAELMEVLGEQTTRAALTSLGEGREAGDPLGSIAAGLADIGGV